MSRRAVAALVVVYVVALVVVYAGWHWYVTGYDGPPVPTDTRYVVGL